MPKLVSELITDFLKANKGWHFGGELERRLSAVHKPSTVGRKCRELAEHNIIHKDYQMVLVGKTRKVKVVLYKI